MQPPTQEYILLVEDSIADIRLFLSVLKLQGFTGQIEVLHDGREAMQFLSLSIPLVRYITKPFDLREWEQQIGQFMCEWAQIGVG